MSASAFDLLTNVMAEVPEEIIAQKCIWIAKCLNTSEHNCG